jgi:hypothetical protein
MWGFDGLLEMGNDNDGLQVDLQPAPRFNMSMYERGSLNATMALLCKPGRGKTLEERLNEYLALYQKASGQGGVPDESWWGWTFYPNELKH